MAAMVSATTERIHAYTASRGGTPHLCAEAWRDTRRLYGRDVQQKTQMLLCATPQPRY